eukprot:2636349-Prymnesium_polylepis.1
MAARVRQALVQQPDPTGHGVDCPQHPGRGVALRRIGSGDELIAGDALRPHEHEFHDRSASQGCCVCPFGVEVAVDE